MSLLARAGNVLRYVERCGHRGCLIGGLAVSVRCDPRFTRDVDLAVAVADDAAAETLARTLVTQGLTLGSVVEQEAD